MNSRSEIDCDVLEKQSFWVQNEEPEALAVTIEPWGRVVLVENGADHLVVFSGSMVDKPLIRWGKSSLTIFGWPGSVFVVYRNGEEITSSDVPAPE